MTPLDFLELRELLHGASGFQSKQFRKIEASLGLQTESRFRPEYYKHDTQFGGFNEKDFAEITEFEDKPSLLQLVENWLERMPFFEKDFGWTGKARLNESTPSEYTPVLDSLPHSSTSKASLSATRKPTCSASSTTSSSKPAGALLGRPPCAPRSSSCSTATSRFSASFRAS